MAFVVLRTFSKNIYISQQVHGTEAAWVISESYIKEINPDIKSQASVSGTFLSFVVLSY